MSKPTTEEALTFEVCRYCHGDDSWSKWQPCTEAKAREYKAQDSSVLIRRRTEQSGITKEGGKA